MQLREDGKGFRMVGLGCKNEKLKRVLSFRRQCFMFLNCPSQTLDVSCTGRDSKCCTQAQEA